MIRIFWVAEVPGLKLLLSNAHIQVFYEDDAYTRIKPEFIAVMLLRLQILTP